MLFGTNCRWLFTRDESFLYMYLKGCKERYTVLLITNVFKWNYKSVNIYSVAIAAYQFVYLYTQDKFNKKKTFYYPCNLHKINVTLHTNFKNVRIK